MKYKYLIIFLYFWLKNEKKKKLISIWIWWFIYYLFSPPHPLTSGDWKPPKITSFSKFSFKISLFGKKFRVKKALVLCNECVMAICIFVCYETRRSLVLVWWVLSWHRFYVNLRMCEEEVNICSGTTTPWKRPLSSPFGRGWGSSIGMIFFFFLWWILAICEKCFGKRIPQIYLFFKSPKIATILPIIFSSFKIWIYIAKFG